MACCRAATKIAQVSAVALKRAPASSVSAGRNFSSTSQVCKGSNDRQAEAKRQKNANAQGAKKDPVRILMPDYQSIIDAPIPTPSYSHIPEGKASSYNKANIGRLMTFPLKELELLLKSAGGSPTAIHPDVFPFSILRQQSLGLVAQLEADVKNQQTKSYILVGSQGCGKSHLLLQTMAYFATKPSPQAITLYISRFDKVTNGDTNFLYNPKTMIFDQLEYSVHLLQSLLTLNAKQLGKIKMTNSRKFTVYSALTGDEVTEFQSDKSTVLDLIKYGLQSTSAPLAVEILELVFEELASQTANPFVIGIDQAQGLFDSTAGIHTSDLKKTESYHFSVPKLILDYISGRKKISSGSIILSTSSSLQTFPFSTSLLKGLNLPSAPYNRFVSPFAAPKSPLSENNMLNKWHVSHAEKCTVVNLPEGMSVEEAGGLWEVRKQAGKLRVSGSDEEFLSKYVETQGNPGEFMFDSSRTLLGTRVTRPQM